MSAAAIDDRPRTLFEARKADELAARLNADPEDDWRYEAIHRAGAPRASLVAVYDEIGEFVAYF